jgi:signal transduction histidine kinase
MSVVSHSITSFIDFGLHTGRSPRAEHVCAAQHANLAKRGLGGAYSEEVAIICHELRNSLAVVRGAARLLRSPAARDGIEARALIERHVGQMSRHIDDLLDPKRRGELNHGLQLAKVDLAVIAGYAADAIAPDMARRGHRLVVKLPEEPIWAFADGSRLEQAFANLLINAAKYTPDGGDIAFTLERDHERVCIRIRDSGIGIEPGMLSRIFGMFVQVGPALPSAEGGRGIGLAVVRDLVELHDGTVRAVSAGPGLGSEFIIVLPTLCASPGLQGELSD